MQPEWKVAPEQEFRIENRRERIPEWLVQELSVVLVKIRRWNELVPEWKSFRYHVNSPLKNSLTMEHCHVRKYWTHSPHIPPTNWLSRDVIDVQIFKIVHDAWKRDERQSQSSNSWSCSTFTCLCLLSYKSSGLQSFSHRRGWGGGELRSRRVVRLLR